MVFKRPRVRYATTPESTTPYQAAGQVWDARLGSLRAQAIHWRWAAFGCLGVTVLLAAGLVGLSLRARITPYVVEVDRLGEVKTIGAALEHYRPSDAQIAHQLERFVRDVRSLPLDPIVLRENWLEAYDTVTDRGAASLNDYARVNNRFGDVGQNTIAVEVTSVVRASEKSFQVRWMERAYTNGALATTQRWTSILSFVVQPPSDEQRLRKNPLGVYVDGLNWSRDVNSQD